MEQRSASQGVYVRHRKSCTKTKARRDGKCCDASFFGTVQSGGKTVKGPSMPTREAADQWRSATKLQASKGVPVGQSSDLTVRDASGQFLVAAAAGVARNKRSQVYKANTLGDYQSSFDAHINRRIGDTKLERVARRDVQQVIDDLVLQGLSGSRIRNVVTAIRALYRWANDRDLVDIDPARNIRLPAMDEHERDDIPTPERLAEAIAVLPLKDRIPFALAGYGTARLSEALCLTWGNVEIDGKSVRLTLGEDKDRGRKSRKAWRTVTAPAPLATLLREWFMACGRPEADAFVLDQRGYGYHGNGLYKRCETVWAAQDPEIEPLRLHAARHCAASILIASGVEPKVISDAMGHSTIAITFDRYGHLFPGSTESAAAKVDAWLTERAQ